MTKEDIAFEGNFEGAEGLDEFKRAIKEACDSPDPYVRASGRIQRALLPGFVEAIRGHLIQEGTAQEYTHSVTAFGDLTMSIFQSVFVAVLPPEMAPQSYALFQESISKYVTNLSMLAELETATKH